MDVKEAVANPLDAMSLHALTFLSERTDFSEPWLGLGFATEMKKEIDAALVRKAKALGIPLETKEQP